MHVPQPIYTILKILNMQVLIMYTFLIILALVIMFVVGSAAAMRYFDKPRLPKKKDEQD